MNARLAAGLAAAALVGVGAGLIIGLSADGSSTASVPTTTLSLADQKTQAEIRKLDAERVNSTGVRGVFSAYGAFITALLTGLAAIGGLVATIRKQTQEQSRQRQADRDQREREREQRDVESRRRLDERFTATLAELGATSEAVQVGAAVSLLSFLRDEQRDFHHQVRLVALANLKVSHPAPVHKQLVRVLEAALRTPDPLEPLERDFSGAELERADLSKLDLAEADLDDANLRGADLTNTSLARAEGRKVVLERARPCGPLADLTAIRFRGAQAAGAVFRQATLISAHLEQADLRGAQFQQARLQAAHLEGADLKGARFESADLNDVYFCNGGLEAEFDATTARSITRALNWENAHFCDRHRAQVDAASTA